jgi:hypothetical protein
MRKASTVVVAMILAVALYFTLVWGYDAVHVLTSPTYGLEDVWRGQFLFGIGRIFGLDPDALVRLAIFYGVMKLTVAGVCGVYVISRIRTLSTGQANSEVFEAGLIMVTLLSLAAVIPALWMQNMDVVRDETIQLLMAAVAAALCVIERTDVAGASTTVRAMRKLEVWQPHWYTPWRG